MINCSAITSSSCMTDVPDYLNECNTAGEACSGDYRIGCCSRVVCFNMTDSYDS